jgi:hypothetical protein
MLLKKELSDAKRSRNCQGVQLAHVKSLLCTKLVTASGSTGTLERLRRKGGGGKPALSTLGDLGYVTLFRVFSSCLLLAWGRRQEHLIFHILRFGGFERHRRARNRRCYSFDGRGL